MKIFSELKKLAEMLQSYPGSWALCGGVVASIYRKTPRFTADIDVALVSSTKQSAEEIAQGLLHKMNYNPIFGFVSGLNNNSAPQKALISGRDDKNQNFIGIDFLLPVFPWIPNAVIRAQGNLIDYGFGKLATITIEDLLIAKIFALTANRSQDIEDIRSILLESLAIDSTYILKEASALKLIIPAWISELLNKR